MTTAMLQILAVLLMYYPHNIESRTCICAEFKAEECDTYLNCKWNLMVPSQSHTGVCRSLKWMVCHNDPLCTIKYRAPEELHMEDDDENKIQDNHHEPNEDDNYDWPWHCDSSIYATHAIDVKPLELAAYNIDIIQQNKQLEKDTNTISAGNIIFDHSFGLIQII
eukprot:1010224_1